MRVLNHRRVWMANRKAKGGSAETIIGRYTKFGGEVSSDLCNGARSDLPLATTKLSYATIHVIRIRVGTQPEEVVNFDQGALLIVFLLLLLCLSYSSHCRIHARLRLV